MSRWRAEPHRLVVPSGDDAVEALDRHLGPDALPRGARVVFELPAAHVHPLLLPWNAQPGRAAQRQAFARACFRDVFGALADGWSVCVDEPRYGAPTLACATSGALVEGLLAMAARRGLKVVRVEPALMRAFNAHRAGLDEQPCWIAVPEPPALTLMLVEARALRRVKRLAGSAQRATELAAHEWFLLGRENPCPRVLVADLPAPPRVAAA